MTEMASLVLYEAPGTSRSVNVTLVPLAGLSQNRNLSRIVRMWMEDASEPQLISSLICGGNDLTSSALAAISRCETPSGFCDSP